MGRILTLCCLIAVSSVILTNWFLARLNSLDTTIACQSAERALCLHGTYKTRRRAGRDLWGIQVETTVCHAKHPYGHFGCQGVAVKVPWGRCGYLDAHMSFPQSFCAIRDSLPFQPSIEARVWVTGKTSVVAYSLFVIATVWPSDLYAPVDAMLSKMRAVRHMIFQWTICSNCTPCAVFLPWTSLTIIRWKTQI